MRACAMTTKTTTRARASGCSLRLANRSAAAYLPQLKKCLCCSVFFCVCIFPAVLLRRDETMGPSAHAAVWVCDLLPLPRGKVFTLAVSVMGF